MFTPTTNLRLLSVPLENDYKNTLYFSSAAAQTAYFLTKSVKSYSLFTYIKKDNTIVIPEEIDTLYNCNYIMYQNTNYGTKWFYAFINRMEWAGMGQTRLFVSTDCIQTWFFDIKYYQSYVDRCHSDTDVAGDNIVPEDFTGANNGGYDVVGTRDLTPDWVTIFATTSPNGSPLEPTDKNGIISGAGQSLRIPYNQSSLANALNMYVTEGTASAVTGIQQFPNFDVNNTFQFAKHPSALTCAAINGKTAYIPKNKKLLSGAFLTGFVQFMGQEINFNPEYANGSNITGKIVVDEVGGLVGVILTNYSSSDIASMSAVASIPESSWSYNQYKNNFNLHNASNSIYYQRTARQRTQNIANSIADAAQGALNAVGSLGNFATLSSLVNPIGSTTRAISGTISGVQSAANNMEEVYRYSSGIDEISQELATIAENYSAPAVGGISSSNIFIAGDMCKMTYGYKVPPLDIVERYDNFLTVYGYKQSTYRDINLHARLNWTYIKTVGLNASGDFPDDDMNVIKRAFDRGIFFWSSTAQFGNFNVPNPIV